jgi:acyl carrier protein
MAAGLDSLGAVELRNTLEASLQASLPPTLVRLWNAQARMQCNA